MEAVEARLETAPKPKDTPPPALSSAPIRRVATSVGAYERNASLSLFEILAAPVAPFSATKETNGDILIHGEGEFSAEGEALLKRFGLTQAPRRGPGWERRIREAQFATFQHRVLNDSKTEIAAVLGALKTPHGDARLVYTGQPLDVATADPALFVEVGKLNATTNQLDEKRYYARSARLYAGKDNRILLESNFAPAGIDKPLPPDTAQLSIAPDGVVAAVSNAGARVELGRLKVVRAKAAKESALAPGFFEAASTEAPDAGAALLLPGHIFAAADGDDLTRVKAALHCHQVVYALQQGVVSAANLIAAAAAPDEALPLIVHAPLSRVTEHLKALGIAVEKNNERTTIGTDEEEEAVVNALVKVMAGLRRRMEVHEENLRNAGKTRDADGRLNAYHRKTVSIGPKGALIEGVDNSALPKTYKPGDPDAGPDGFVVMPNVNKAVETAEFKAAIEEYKLLRSALERLAPRHVFPDPPAAP